jgi:hypothetical protein
MHNFRKMNNPKNNEITTLVNLKMLFAVHLFVSSYGWFLLIGGVSLYYLWTKKVSPALSSATSLKPKSPEGGIRFFMKQNGLT